MPKLFVEPIFTIEEAERVVAALEASQEHEIAKKVRRRIEIDRRASNAREAARIAEEDRRAARAKNHTLTKRQAECLAAVRAGKSPSEQPWFWTDDMGVKQWRWRYGRSVGGAINRMVETLINEGMMTERPRGLTEAGRSRLDAWEAKHRKIGGDQ